MKKFLTWFESKRAALQASLEQSISAPGAPLLKAAPVASKAEPLRKRGSLLLEQGKLDEALDCYTQGSLLDPNDALCFSNLGFILAQLGRPEEAMVMLRKAVVLDAENYDAHFIMGSLLFARGDHQGAVSQYTKALEIKPDFTTCRDALCAQLIEGKQFEKARAVLQAGFAHEQDLANYYLRSGNMYVAEGLVAKAGADFKQALKFRPDDISVLGNLASTQLELRDMGAAIATCKTILQYEPDNINAVSNLGVAYLLSGKYELAVHSLQRALTIDPDNLTARQNLLYMLSFGVSCSPSEYLDAAMAYGKKVSALATPYSTWLCDETAGRSTALRIGFVSGDLHQHPVGYFLESIVQKMDANRMVLVAYSCGTTQDALSLRLKSHFKEWNAVNGVLDRELAEKIHGDAIDILVDLSGHTELNRLSMFAWRPAPIQVSWLGYWASTGLQEMDYLLADEITAPPQDQRFYTEKLWYLPSSRFCFTPPQVAQGLEVAPPPVCENGFITFGSYQAIHKINDGTLRLWSRVMAAVPGSRLRIQNAQLVFPDVAQDLNERLASAGIDISRVSLQGPVERQKYLTSYQAVDMVLDTFPYPGGTTTVEALWMGVPTVTLTGNSLLARQGEGLLRAVSLSQYVAQSEDAYLAIAVRQAANRDGLVATRNSLRDVALKSPLFDAAGFSGHLAESFQAMWQRRKKG